MKNHYIYLITNKINGKKYIGKRSCNCDINKDKYMGSGKLINRAKSKYGIENFTKTIIEICDTEEIAYEREKFWIREYEANNNKGFYNISAGGNGGNILINLSQEEKDKIYSKVRNTWKNKDKDEFIKKMTEINKNKWKNKSEEEMNEFRKKCREIQNRDEVKKKNSDSVKKAWKNKTEEEMNEFKKKCSIAQNNPEVKEKIRQKLIGRIPANSKKCVIVINGKEIIKDSIRKMNVYMKEEYGIAVHKWFNKNGCKPVNKYNDIIDFVGFIDSKEYVEFKGE